MFDKFKKMKVSLLLLSLLGTVFVMVYPAGHAAFCATVENLVL